MKRQHKITISFDSADDTAASILEEVEFFLNGYVKYNAIADLTVEKEG